jgi:membrane-associated phospholipid phosphatase
VASLLPVALRRPAAVLLAVCVAVTVLLALAVAGQARAGWLDTAVDAWVRASLGRHPAPLSLLAGLGDPVPVTVMTVALVLACLAARRRRGAALAGVAVPVAAALTEFVLKPVIGRTLAGSLSFPSGHATSMFALAVTCAVLLTGQSRPRVPAALRLSLALGAVIIAGAVAIAMVGLGFHYFTDIVGGAAVGTAIVLLTAFTLDRSIPAAAPLGRPSATAAPRAWRSRSLPPAITSGPGCAERSASGKQGARSSPLSVDRTFCPHCAGRALLLSCSPSTASRICW